MDTQGAVAARVRVLVADDTPSIRMLLSDLLGSWGFEVTAVEDGGRALRALDGDLRPDIAILDWNMPEVSGPDVCRRIKDRDESLFVYPIIMTAMEEKEHIVEGLEAGASDYIIKPFDYDEMKARLDVGVRFVRLHHELVRHIKDLKDALEHVRTLQGILPICMHCKRIRNDEKTWQRLEEYISAHSNAMFSHSLCNECLARYYPDDAQDKT